MKAIQNFFQSILDLPRDQLILKLALFFVLAFTDSRWNLHIPVQVLALFMLLDNRFSANPVLWGALCMGHFLPLVLEWDITDNHKYLFFYWLLVCTLSLRLKEQNKRLDYLSQNAHLLVGLCFLFTVVWKISGGQFLNGKFLHFTFLTDERFEFMVGYITDLTRDILPANYLLMDNMKRLPLLYPQGTLLSPSWIREMALMLSWWTLLIEGAVAYSFLAPRHFPLSKLRHGFLLVFIFTTYAFVPVPGFNFILVLLGLSHLRPEDKKWAPWYILALVVTEVRKIPFSYYYFYLQNLF